MLIDLGPSTLESELPEADQRLWFCLVLIQQEFQSPELKQEIGFERFTTLICINSPVSFLFAGLEPQLEQHHSCLSNTVPRKTQMLLNLN